MKLKYTFLTGTLLFFAAYSAASIAVEETKAVAPAVKADAAKTDAGEVKKPVKKAKKHSHMEEKTGMPMPEPVAAEGKVVPKNRHDHTKEKR